MEADTFKSLSVNLLYFMIHDATVTGILLILCRQGHYIKEQVPTLCFLPRLHSMP